MNAVRQQGSAASSQPILSVQDVRKHFGAVHALRGVDLTVFPGEVHALVGENGAGKSTLMRILSGAHQPDGGRIEHNGRIYQVSSPVQARQRGLAMIYQELTLAPHMTVAQNLTLGREDSVGGWIRDPRERMSRALGQLGHADLDLDTPVRELSIGTQQIVEIARALLWDARLVIMDEPTSSLSTSDAQALFGVIRQLAASGIAVIYISHFLEEVFRLADRITVMRDGMTVGSALASEVSLENIVHMMVGRTLDEMSPRIAHDIGETVLTLDRLSGQGAPREVSLELRRGEILGIAGLVGSGRSEMIRTAFGLRPAKDGTLSVRGTALRARMLNPCMALRHGLDLLSENRKEEGLATDRSVRDNICMSSLQRLSRRGLLSGREERAAAAHWCDRLAIRCPDVGLPVRQLSGGNQQKVALARILLHDSDILFLDEPTRGIDVGSKADICRLIGDLAAQGRAVVVISSYLPELLGICDTLAVMFKGRLSPKRPVGEWDQHSIMRYATSGHSHDEP